MSNFMKAEYITDSDISYFHILVKNFICGEKKSIGRDWIVHVTCMACGLKAMDQSDSVTKLYIYSLM